MPISLAFRHWARGLRLAALASAIFGASFLPVLAKDGTHEVDVELVLAVDISYSMDPEEQALQREGYMQAITSPEILAATLRVPQELDRQHRHALHLTRRVLGVDEHRVLRPVRVAGEERVDDAHDPTPVGLVLGHVLPEGRDDVVVHHAGHLTLAEGLEEGHPGSAAVDDAPLRAEREQLLKEV